VTGLRTVEPLVFPRLAREADEVLRYDEPARILDGRPLAAQIRQGVRRQVRAFRTRYGFSPELAVIKVGRRLDSSVYVQQILRSCAQVGIPSRVVELPMPRLPMSCALAIEQLNGDDRVAGIIVQQPLPRHIPLSTVTDTILPAKDIDGIHPLNTG
jgi:methylenetetrahydrofolate dehydrogenase (NADP+) / methenyltetrahydrofolate cyclohydrolase